MSILSYNMGKLVEYDAFSSDSFDGAQSLENSTDRVDDQEHQIDEDCDDHAKSLVIKMKGFPKFDKFDIMSVLFELFQNYLKIPLPMMRMPKGKDKWVYLKLNNFEEKNFVLENFKGAKQSKFSLKAATCGVPTTLKPKDPLDYEDGLNILFKYRNTLYKEQLNIKKKETENLFEEILNTKQITSKYEVDNVVPLVPTEGYSYYASLMIETDPVTNQYVVGQRVYTETKERIIPIDMCPNIPKFLREAVNAFVRNFSVYGLIPYNYENETGNITGIEVTMNRCCEMMFVVHVPKKNTFLQEFVSIKTPQELQIQKEEEMSKPKAQRVDFSDLNLPEADEDDEEASDDEKEAYWLQIKDIIPGLKKFFEENGKSLGVISMYTNWILYNRRGEWSKKQHFYNFVCGTKTIKNIIIDAEYEIFPDKPFSPPEPEYTAIINTINGLVKMNVLVSLAVASEYHQIGIYYSKLCRDVLCLLPTAAGQSAFLKSSRELNFENIEYFSTRNSLFGDLEKTHFARSQFKKVVIMWKHTKVTIVRKLYEMNVHNILIVLRMGYDAEQNKNEILKFVGAISPNFVVNRIVPVDTDPLGSSYHVVIVAENSTPESTKVNRKRRAEPLNSSVENSEKRPPHNLPSLLDNIRNKNYNANSYNYNYTAASDKTASNGSTPYGNYNTTQYGNYDYNQYASSYYNYMSSNYQAGTPYYTSDMMSAYMNSQNATQATAPQPSATTSQTAQPPVPQSSDPTTQTSLTQQTSGEWKTT